MINELIFLIKSLLNEKIQQLDISDYFVEILVRSGLILLILLTCWFIHKIIQGTLLRYFEKFTRFTNQQWDNVLVEKIFRRLLYFIPLIIIYIIIPQILEGTAVLALSLILINIILIIAGVLTIDALLNSIAYI